MWSVSPHKGCQIFFPLAFKVLAVITCPLCDSPGIKSFIKHIHTQSVAGFQQSQRRRVMCGPDRIETDLFQFFHFSDFALIQRNGTEKTIVMMQAAAF